MITVHIVRYITSEIVPGSRADRNSTLDENWFYKHRMGLVDVIRCLSNFRTPDMVYAKSVRFLS
jgi:hypothetical protein